LLCRRTSEGVVERNDDGATTVDGVYVAGDQTDIVRQVNVAAASGHKVAAKIVEQLAHEDRLSELKDWQLNSKEPPLS
jgi:thioredoxin reductase